MRAKQLIVIGAALGIPELLKKYLEPPTKVAKVITQQDIDRLEKAEAKRIKRRIRNGSRTD